MLKKLVKESVYNVTKLNLQYKPEDHQNAWGSYIASPEQDFVYSRVMHEHAIFRRHVVNGLRIVGPCVAYTCLNYLEVSISVPMKILSCFVLGYMGSKVVGEVLCEIYRLLNLAAGSFISYKYDAYGHWDFLRESKPYLCESKDCLKLLFPQFIIAFIFVVLIQNDSKKGEPANTL